MNDIFICEEGYLRGANQAYTNIDATSCKLICSHNTIFVFVVYIIGEININELEMFFYKFLELDFIQNNNVLLVGDFNVSLLNLNQEDSKSIIFNNLLNFLGLNQYNKIAHVNGRLLGLAFSNINGTIKKKSCLFLKEDVHPSSIMGII